MAKPEPARRAAVADPRSARPEDARPAAPIVRFAGVGKSFAGVPVLSGVDLDVAPGERVALIGPSGSGKTTLLRLLMTLERPDSGEIEVGGEALWHRTVRGRVVPADERHLRRLRGRISMVFQHFNLFPHMSVLRNLTEAPVHVLGQPRRQAEAHARELLAMVGLASKADARPAQLSGGQRQRVAIARALAVRPEIMLFDEITSALDPELVGEVLGVLRRLAAETRTTMLIVTHEMQFARDVADRVVFLDGGQVVEQAPPEVIFRQPRSERTRRFLKAVLER